MSDEKKLFFLNKILSVLVPYQYHSIEKDDSMRLYYVIPHDSDKRKQIAITEEYIENNMAPYYSLFEVDVDGVDDYSGVATIILIQNILSFTEKIITDSIGFYVI